MGNCSINYKWNTGKNIPQYTQAVCGISGFSRVDPGNICFFLVLLFFVFISKLYSPFEGKDIYDVCELLGGSFLRVTAGSVTFLGLVFATFVILREYGENMKIISFKISPLSFVMMFFIICAIIGAYLGLETITRMHAFFSPVIIAGLLFILVGAVNSMDTTNLLPILGEGANHVFGEGILRISLFVPILYLFLVPPYIKTNRNFKIVGYTAIGMSGILVVFTTIVYLLVFPMPTSTESFLPVFQLARLINYGRFFQRVESVFMLIWATTASMYLSLLLFFTGHVFQKTFKLKYRRPLILPLGVIIFSLSFLPPNLVTAIKLETQYFSFVSISIVYVMIPLILLFAYIFRKGPKGAVKNE